MVFRCDAGSWGGVVRSGPGREFSRLGSLAEGERITLIENTGVLDNDYSWFKIRYRGSRQSATNGAASCAGWTSRSTAHSRPARSGRRD